MLSIRKITSIEVRLAVCAMMALTLPQQLGAAEPGWMAKAKYGSVLVPKPASPGKFEPLYGYVLEGPAGGPPEGGRPPLAGMEPRSIMSWDDTSGDYAARTGWVFPSKENCPKKCEEPAVVPVYVPAFVTPRTDPPFRINTTVNVGAPVVNVTMPAAAPSCCASRATMFGYRYNHHYRSGYCHSYRTGY